MAIDHAVHSLERELLGTVFFTWPCEFSRIIDRHLLQNIKNRERDLDFRLELAVG